jgi:hypothetical protein
MIIHLGYIETIRDVGAKSLSESLSKLLNLNFLTIDLAWINISDDGAKSLSESISKLLNLNSLILI